MKMARQQATSSSTSVTTSSDEVHTPTNPYCENLSCWCHTNVEYHDQVTSFSTSISDEEYAWALTFLQGEEEPK